MQVQAFANSGPADDGLSQAQESSRGFMFGASMRSDANTYTP